MNSRKRWLKLLITLVSIAGILILYPKQRVIGGLGGFIGPGKTAYREDYTCVGVKFDLPPLAYAIDGQYTHLCFGLITNRVCTIESYNADDTITYTPIACNE